MESFVGKLGEENLDPWVVQRVCELLKILVLGSRGDQDKLERVAIDDALERRAKLFQAVVNGGNHHCHVFRFESGVFRQRLRFVRPVAYCVDNEADITV